MWYNEQQEAIKRESMKRRHTVHQMYAESNVTSCICHKLGICTLTNPSAHDVSIKFQAHDRHRKSRYSLHTSDAQYAFDTLSLYYNYTLARGSSHYKLVCEEFYNQYM